MSSGMMEQVASYVAYPVLKIHQSISESLRHQSEQKMLSSDLQKKLQAKEIESVILLKKIAQLESQQRLLDQTVEVREFAARYDDAGHSLAKVLRYTKTSQEDSMFIEGGRNCGYSKDDVVVYQNALIGRIIQVYPWYSKVALISDKRCRVSVVIGTDAQGISCGLGQGALNVSFVPHYKSVHVGDLVISTGSGLVYPAGFTLGTVATVTTDLVSHSITVQPYYSFEHIEYVYVLFKGKKSDEAQEHLIPAVADDVSLLTQQHVA